MESKITAHKRCFQMAYELNDLVRRENRGCLIAVCNFSVALQRRLFLNGGDFFPKMSDSKNVSKKKKKKKAKKPKPTLSCI